MEFEEEKKEATDLGRGIGLGGKNQEKDDDDDDESEELEDLPQEIAD